jgi:hypothetical protein
MVWTNEESPDGPVTTVTLEEKGGKTLLVLSELHPSKAALDAAGTGALDAMTETFGQLDELVAELIAGSKEGRCRFEVQSHHRTHLPATGWGLQRSRKDSNPSQGEAESVSC